MTRLTILELGSRLGASRARAAWAAAASAHACARGGEKGGGTPPQQISTSDHISHASDQPSAWPSDWESVCTRALATRAQGTGERAVNISVCAYPQQGCPRKQQQRTRSISSAHAAVPTLETRYSQIRIWLVCLCVVVAREHRRVASPAGARASPLLRAWFLGPTQPALGPHREVVCLKNHTSLPPRHHQ